MPEKRRVYRAWLRQEDLTFFEVKVKETDLLLGVRRERFSPSLVWKVEKLVREQRQLLEEYLRRDPAFATALTPHQVLPDAPPIAWAMAEAARLVGVGPMAAVAGAFADLVGKYLGRFSREVVVENGGDIYLKSTRQRTVGIYAGNSPLSSRVALAIPANLTPLGICTSSGTVGHSLSFGKADAAVVLASTATLADAAATALGNRVQTPEDIEEALSFIQKIPGVLGAVVIIGKHLGVWGKARLVPLEPGQAVTEK
ncbi:ApbE family lipoprotein [Ammonifex degensii KC4]|uniref:ApbE family lipoprotein n=1 Tax=Ammonifex degensii (strain DSM 10501 / KC4) TaxID=429009 RepID=C9R8A1_AMMDK|nr:UPF0280 family protein [Ammonifex degensii]ACX52530.1 ApbE family lipoprotein [Ammonifex degensii KC4]